VLDILRNREIRFNTVMDRKQRRHFSSMTF